MDWWIELYIRQISSLFMLRWIIWAFWVVHAHGYIGGQTHRLYHRQRHFAFLTDNTNNVDSDLRPFLIINWVYNVKLATVNSFKADVSSVSPSSEKMTRRERSKRQLWNSYRWPILRYQLLSALKLLKVANSRYQPLSTVDNTELPCYTLPPTQHHSFFRNLRLLAYRLDKQLWKEWI